jgi:3D (Asp-Asp-Asp) domain-containing protein
MRARETLWLALAAACSGGGDWVRGVTPSDATPVPSPDEPWREESRERTPPPAEAPPRTEPAPEDLDDADPYEADEGRPRLRLRGSATPKRSERALDEPAPTDPELFHNTYYDFPVEPDTPEPGPTRTLFDAACHPIRVVSQAFHDAVCVQGSGRLHDGATVSFARRDCDCAAECPRTGQKICFEALDPARFPHGRGATGRAITPLRTVAVDTDVVALGTPLYIPDFHGLRDLRGRPHDGCFVAEDRGLKVKGRHVDVFTGDPSLTRAWNAAVPTGRGVRVLVGASRCPKTAGR